MDDDMLKGVPIEKIIEAAGIKDILRMEIDLDIFKRMLEGCENMEAREKLNATIVKLQKQLDEAYAK
jgi:hypothetical protein